MAFGASFPSFPALSASASASQPTQFSFSPVPCFSNQPNSTHATFSGKRGRERTTKVLLAAENGQSVSGNSESRQVLDAFFLGKAFADTVNERLGSAIGEFLSEVGKKQAENQKEIRKFQEEVQERAKLSKIRASRQALSKEDIKATQNSRAASVESIPIVEPVSIPQPPSAPEQEQK